MNGVGITARASMSPINVEEKELAKMEHREAIEKLRVVRYLLRLLRLGRSKGNKLTDILELVTRCNVFRSYEGCNGF